jgi:hypothetical protein
VNVTKPSETAKLYAELSTVEGIHGTSIVIDDFRLSELQNRRQYNPRTHDAIAKNRINTINHKDTGPHRISREDC